MPFSWESRPATMKPSRSAGCPVESGISTKWLMTLSRSGAIPARRITSARNLLGLMNTSTGS